MDRHIKLHMDRQLTSYGLNGSQYFYILRICDQPGLTQDELMRTSHIHPSNITRAMTALEKAGYIRKEGSTTDKRSYLLFPTERGKEIYDRLIQIQKETEAALLEVLNPEERALVESLEEKLALRAIALAHGNAFEETGTQEASKKYGQ